MLSHCRYINGIIGRGTRARCGQLSTALVFCMVSVTSWAAEPASQPESGWWNAILLLVVAAATAGSAYLPISAFKYWTGYWKLVAAMPLLVFAGWVSWIVIARLLDAAAHPYWMLEVFAWAMLAMLYMATVMTAKRQFDKADNPDNP